MPTSFDKVMAAHVEARQYGETFVDFTNDLVSGVIETLVKSGMDQMTSYAELIQAISDGQSKFQQNVTGLSVENFSAITTTDEAILNDYITDVFAGMNIADISQKEADGLIDHFNGTTIPTGSSDNIVENSIADIMVGTASPYTITEAALQEFVFNKLMGGAAKNYDTLVTLVREGWIKILPTNWNVSTDLSFHITSEDTTSMYSSYYKQKASGWSANHTSGVGFSLGKILSLSSTNTFSASRSKLRVSTKNNSTTGNVTSDVLFKGHVSITGTAVQHPSVTIVDSE